MNEKEKNSFSIQSKSEPGIRSQGITETGTPILYEKTGRVLCYLLVERTYIYWPCKKLDCAISLGFFFA